MCGWKEHGVHNMCTHTNTHTHNLMGCLISWKERMELFTDTEKIFSVEFLCVELMIFPGTTPQHLQKPLWCLTYSSRLYNTDECVWVAQSCPTLCDPMDCRLSGSSDHGILQARILEWVAIPFSKGSSWPRDWTQVSHIVGRCFTLWATREAQ